MVSRAFFGKSSCFKVQFRQGNCYFQMGKKTGEKWEWDKLKMNDVELGEIVRVLNKGKEKMSAFHKFKSPDGKESENKLWISHAPDGAVFVKINDTTKSMSDGEQEVLRILLERIVFMMVKAEE